MKSEYRRLMKIKRLVGLPASLPALLSEEFDLFNYIILREGRDYR